MGATSEAYSWGLQGIIWEPFVANAGNVEGLPPFAMWSVGGEADYTYYTGIEGWMYYAAIWASIGLAGTAAA